MRRSCSGYQQIGPNKYWRQPFRPIYRRRVCADRAFRGLDSDLLTELERLSVPADAVRSRNFNPQSFDPRVSNPNCINTSSCLLYTSPSPRDA
eukprot:9725822-Heterocapsa_arctica.AAC.1